MSKLLALALVLLCPAALVFPGIALSQSDPGVRPGPINGQNGATQGSPLPLPSVNSNNPAGILDFFDNGLGRFQEEESVSSGDDKGLGPRFNFNSCSGCHAQPAVGGSSPANNPQFQAITQGIASGSTNTLPSFITAHGPTLEARFPFFMNSNGTPNRNAPNGGVEAIFTVSGRADAGSCNLQQPDFRHAQQSNNIIFRIPTPVFGAGLIENIDDSTLLANQEAQAANNFGVGGAFNRNGNDGTIARFGWKAQNKSLLLFSGEAYNVEMGITSELFAQERPLPEEEQGSGLPANCLNLGGRGYPEDATNINVAANSDQAAQNAQVPADSVLFAEFMRLLAPPAPSTHVPGGQQSISNGFALFKAVGCSTCHTPAIKSTQPSNITASLGNATVRAFSDFEIHHMGSGLADNVSQGAAGGDQFRSAPLWGLGQRIFFLHDGRTTNLMTAITAHRSNGSEATQVAENFTSLSRGQQQDVLNFLRSL
ncbi:MAG TPA: di-heme oxidoredictase family protein [Steroidobacteraceae bacterium]|nr:di-heme oxidoredictase family protein [Steroidobacteraceae bacterium]